MNYPYNSYAPYPYGQQMLYTPQMQQPQMQQSVQNRPVQDDRIWVPNEAAANAYMVAANGFVQLWDSSRQSFYEKSADAMGKQYPMVIYDYAPRAAQTAPNASTADYITRDEFEKRIAKLEAPKEVKSDE